MNGPSMLAALVANTLQILEEVREHRVVATFNAHNEHDVRVLSQAPELRRELDEFARWIRTQDKHGPRTLDTREVHEKFLDSFSEFLGD